MISLKLLFDGLFYDHNVQSSAGLTSETAKTTGSTGDEGVLDWFWVSTA